MEPSPVLTCPRVAGRCDEIPILLVDEDEGFRTGVAELLRDDGHDVRHYNGPLDVPPLTTCGDIGVLIASHPVADQNGLGFVDAFHRAYPSVPVVLLTTYPRQQLAGDTPSRSFLHVREKPLDYGSLHSFVHQLAT